MQIQELEDSIAQLLSKAGRTNYFELKVRYQQARGGLYPFSLCKSLGNQICYPKTSRTIGKTNVHERTF